jgi:hypothetical protein
MCRWNRAIHKNDVTQEGHEMLETMETSLMNTSVFLWSFKDQKGKFHDTERFLFDYVLEV